MESSSSILRHPERLHPGLWRASQLAMAARPVLSTGFAQLDCELPGGGWPLGALIEFACQHPGIGEIHLLRPALAHLDPELSIMMVSPPYAPHHQCWVNWGLARQRLFWIRPRTADDALWACEKILQHNSCSALLYWADHLPRAALQRLHLSARQSNLLFVLLRPLAQLRQPSTAPLRLGLHASPEGLSVHIAKRSGPHCAHAISIALHPQRPVLPVLRHHVPVALDLSAPAHPQPGYALSGLAH